MSRTDRRVLNSEVSATGTEGADVTRICHVPGIGYFPTQAQRDAQDREAKARTELIHHAAVSGKLLYAISYLHGPQTARKMDYLYCHAVDAGDARVQFFHSPAAKGLSHMTIVAVGPVIGYHVKDNHGDNLSV